MSSTGEVGKIKVDTIKQTYVEWEIENFFSSTVSRPYTSITSPCFDFANASWYLRIDPNGRCADNNTGWIGVYLMLKQNSKEGNETFDITIGIKGDEKYQVTQKNVLVKIGTFGPGTHKLVERMELYQIKCNLVPKDTLTIFCRAIISFKEKYIDDLSTLSEDLENLFINEKNYDAEINVKGKIFHVHKLILGSRSPVLSAMFDHNMKEKNYNAVNIDDCEPEIFHNFLLFLYSGKAKNLSPANAVRMYKIADKYISEELKKKCSNFMEANLNIDNICEILTLADCHHEDQLKETASEWVKNNLTDLIQTEQWITFMEENSRLAAELLKKALLA